MKYVDHYLNKVTMYNLLMYGLAGILAVATMLSLLGSLDISPVAMWLTALVFVGSTVVGNKLAGWLYGAQSTPESSVITGLILAFLFQPTSEVLTLAAYGAIGIIAAGSKYLLAFRGRHLVNPAAFAAVVAGPLGFGYATWWIGTGVLLPFVVFVGVLIARKLRRSWMVALFAAVALASLLLAQVDSGQTIGSILSPALLSGPLVFLGCYMLTEPVTTPPTRRSRAFYAIAVALLFGLQLQLGGVYVSPEIALVTGNLLVYGFTLRRRLLLKLQSSELIGGGVTEYRFVPDAKLNFEPGQYVETSLPSTSFDSRGSRRTFTIASSPTESDVILGIKHVTPSSQFKRRLANLKTGQSLYATNIGGSFTLPKDSKQKLVFLAGGIGITPFRSMAKFLTDTRQRRDAILIYATSDAKQLAFVDVFETAAKVGLKTHYVVSGNNVPKNWKGKRGYVTKDLIQQCVPDSTERLFYISGPELFVKKMQNQLHDLGVHHRHIRTDYFSGY